MKKNLNGCKDSPRTSVASAVEKNEPLRSQRGAEGEGLL